MNYLAQLAVVQSIHHARPELVVCLCPVELVGLAYLQSTPETTLLGRLRLKIFLGTASGAPRERLARCTWSCADVWKVLECALYLTAISISLFL